MAGTGTAHMRPADEALLRVEDLRVEFPAGRRRRVQAVSGISFDVVPGETLSLVGESGCGKSTIGRSIVQLPRPTSGRVVFGGCDLTRLSKSELRAVRPELQLIYQDPISSLNPRRTVRRIIEEPLRIWHRDDSEERKKVTDEMLDAVGLDPGIASRHPHEFSGGQCQRICIARALVMNPKMLVCDEPVSALDVSVQAQLLNLLEEMKARYGITILFISHDLAVVKNVSDRVMVMYLGKLCEIGASDELYGQPAHPYTAALLAAAPSVDADEARPPFDLVRGELPSPLSPPSGCRFRTRCPNAQERCAAEEPKMRQILGDKDHFVACHFPLIETMDDGLDVRPRAASDG